MTGKKLYSLTDEHRAQLPAWRDKWIANAMSTSPMTDEDRAITREAILGLYAAANKPAPKVIVFVPSPIVLRIAGGFAAAAIYMRNHKKTKGLAQNLLNERPFVTEYRHSDGVGMLDSIVRATCEAALSPLGDLSVPADLKPFSDSAWFNVNRDSIKELAKLLGVGKFGLQCAQAISSCWSGGNQWSGYDSYLSFFRHVAKLDIDYSKWQHWETLSLHSGPRIIHEHFAMISDRPRVLTVDDNRQPHAESGPFCRWSDGFELYSVHGVRVPAWVVNHPELITVKLIQSEQNAEVRRVMREKYGNGRYLKDIGAKLVHVDTVAVDKQDPSAGSITRALMQDDEGHRWLVGSDGSTNRVYYMRVPDDVQTCTEAHKALCGFDDKNIVVQV